MDFEGSKWARRELEIICCWQDGRRFRHRLLFLSTQAGRVTPIVVLVLCTGFSSSIQFFPTVSRRILLFLSIPPHILTVFNFFLPTGKSIENSDQTSIVKRTLSVGFRFWYLLVLLFSMRERSPVTTFPVTGASRHTTFNCMKSDIQTQLTKNISLLYRTAM